MKSSFKALSTETVGRRCSMSYRAFGDHERAMVRDRPEVFVCSQNLFDPSHSHESKEALLNASGTAYGARQSFQSPHLREG